MKILLDARPLQNAHRFRGIGVYTHKLIEHLDLLEPKVELTLIVDNNKEIPFPEKNFPKLFLKKPAWKFIANRRYLMNNLVLMPKNFYNFKADIVHFPTAVEAPLFPGKKAIATLHDLIPLHYPKQYQPNLKEKIIYKRGLKAARAMQAIITDSNASCTDIIKYLKIDSEIIHVIPLGVDPEFRPIDPSIKQHIRKQFTKDKKYLLVVGICEPRKNLTFIVEVYAQLIKNYNLEQDLVFAGKMDDSPYLPELKRCIENKGIAKRVQILNYLNRADLAQIYSSADLCCCPSLYEGFGLTVLEAMAAGTAAVISDIPAHREIAENVTILVKPEATAEWIKAIKDLLSDPKKKAPLINKGLSRAAQFTWQKTAQLTYQVWQKVSK